MSSIKDSPETDPLTIKLKVESCDTEDNENTSDIASGISERGPNQKTDTGSVLSNEAVDISNSDNLILKHDIKLESDELLSDDLTVPPICDLSSSSEPVDLSLPPRNSAGISTTVKLIACTICNKLFNRTFNLQRHIAVTHAGQRSFICEICGKACAHAYTLKQHMLLHTRSKVFSCDKCYKKYTDPSSLRRHKLRQHELVHGNQGNSVPSRSQRTTLTNGASSYICDQCGKELKSSESLTSHKRTHTGTNRCNCFVCSKTYSSPQSLASHMLTHSGIRPYRCSTCDKRFTHPSHLKRHIRLHTGEKPYKCLTCGRSFNQSSSLRQHVLIHSGQKPHGCETCGKLFRQYSTLQRHRLLHTK